MARSAAKVSASPFQRAAETRGRASGRGPQAAKSPGICAEKIKKG